MRRRFDSEYIESELQRVGKQLETELTVYVVVAESSRSYTVDMSSGACTCDDSFYRQPKGGCKHVRRVKFATERREVPAWVDRSAVDSQLGRHVCDEQSR